VVVLFGCAVVICVSSCVCVSLGLCTAAAVSAGLCAAVYVCVSANLATICVGAVCDFLAVCDCEFVVLTLSVCVYTAVLCSVEFCGCIVILVFRPPLFAVSDPFYSAAKWIRVCSEYRKIYILG